MICDTDRALAAALLPLAGVAAVALGGSRASGLADAASDTDLYALCPTGVPDAAARVRALAPLADGGRVRRETAWGDEDHLHLDGRLVEIVYLDGSVLDVERFYDPGAEPTGYTTAFLHTLAGAVGVADPDGTLAALQERLRTFPEATRARILAQAPSELAGYLTQLRAAQSRGDWTSVTHRRAALQTAWFDLLFALNRRYHPGEKRLLPHAETCPRRPDALRARWTAAALAPADDPGLPDALAALVDDLLALSAPSRRRP